jgi:rhodanese-related sulfurtransferase
MTSAHQGLPEIDATEAARRRERDEAALVDVRERDEWDAGRIAGSQLIPLSELVERQAELPDDRPLVVVCRSGNRSARVVAALAEAGYDATNLAGGLHAWLEAGETLVADGDRPGTLA